MKINRTYKNLISNLIVQIISAISGIIIPRFIISVYGSALNGMVSSVGQFLMYAGLVEAGVGNATVVALYKPLVRNSKEEVDIVLAEATRRYTKSGIIYILISFAIACVYPFTVNEQIDYSFAFQMTIILSMIGIIDYLFIGKYKVLLTADNKYYIINFNKAIATCMLSVGSILMLLNGMSLLTVKGFAVITHFAEAVFIKWYIKYHYPELTFKSDKHIKLEQQGSALVHQICMVITYNTDLIVLTLMLPGASLLEISVYSVYSLVLSFAQNMMSVLYVGISATFGELYAKGDMETLKHRFGHYELLYLVLLHTVYTCYIVLVLPFLRCYVGDVKDVNYIRPEFAVLFGLIGFFAQVKDAYGTLVHGGCGAYKATKKYALMEAIINISLSLILIQKMGVAGVLVGTIVSHLFMDYGVIKYACRNILCGTLKQTSIRILRNTVILVTLCMIEMPFLADVNLWYIWVIAAISVSFINFSIFFALNYFFDPDDMNAVLPMIIRKRWKGKIEG